MTWWRRKAARSVALRQRAATISRSGRRAVNEDATVQVEATGLALHAVADGLGGHARGEVASRAAVAACAAGFRARPACSPRALEALCQAADRGVRAAAGDSTDEAPLSTIVVLVTNGASACWAHVGDSRLYHFRAGAIFARTRDHTVPEMLYQAGDIREEEIRGHPDRNRLLQALGQETPARPSVSDVVPLEAGDAFLLCSDGWWECVREAEMSAALRRSHDPEEWLAAMLSIVESGSQCQDNYTATAVMIG